MERFSIGFKHLLGGKQVSNAYVDFKTSFDSAAEAYDFCKELIHDEKQEGIYDEKNGYYTIIDHFEGTHIYHIKVFKKAFNL